MTEPKFQATDTLAGEDWGGEMGQKWLANLDRFEGMIAPIGAALLARAGLVAGERVLDVGCGGGGTTIAIGHLVAPGGEVLGVDISPDLTQAAIRRASGAGVTNVRFTCADAATVALPHAPYDRLFSRFGSMFFDQPVAAFANLHRLLRPGGRVDLAVWAAPRDNLWIMEIMGVIRTHVEVPAAVPRAPGPFAFEDLDYLQEILTGGGFQAPDIIAHAGLQPVGGHGATPEEAARFALASMSVGRLLDAHGSDVRARAEQDLRAMFASHHVPGKGVMMKGKAWLVQTQA